MNPAHLHLLVNHLPIMGAFLALPLLALAAWRRADRGALLAAVTVLAFAGIGAVVSLRSGDPAEERVEDLPGVSEHWIHVHEERAETATVLSVLTALGGVGLVAWAGRRGSTPLLGVGVVGVAALVTAGAMAWTGQAGGQIRHSELRDDAAAVTEAPELSEDDD